MGRDKREEEEKKGQCLKIGPVSNKHWTTDSVVVEGRSKW